MSCLKQKISMPQTNKHYKTTKSNNVCSKGRYFSITSVSRSFINIRNFNNFQIIYRSNNCISLCNKNKNIKLIIYSLPNNSSFSLKRKSWRKSCKTSHKNSPSKGCPTRTSILPFQIPKILRYLSSSQIISYFISISTTCIFNVLFIFRRGASKRRNWSIGWPQQQTPGTKINNNINEYICPKNLSTWSNRPYSIISYTLRHKENSYVTNTTIRKQTFNIFLCQRCNSSYNYRKCSKQRKIFSKKRTPKPHPMRSPKSENCNFWQKCNPLGYTRPCSHIYIRDPKMQRGYCLFPKLSNRNKPYTNSTRQRPCISCSFTKSFNMRLRSFTNFPINKTNTLKSKTTSKSTLQKIFYSSFKRKSTFCIRTTLNNQRKTLQFHTKVNSYLICCYN
jgi:hypothetical protein